MYRYIKQRVESSYTQKFLSKHMITRDLFYKLDLNWICVCMNNNSSNNNDDNNSTMLELQRRVK